MDWPIPSDYREAIQNPKFCFEDPELKIGIPKLDKLGLPVVMSGSFASVYEIRCKTKKYAVRCFTRHFPDQEERYQIISSYLQKLNLKYFVDFHFISRGIRIKGKWYPILKMEWTDGISLTKYIEDNLNNPHLLKNLADQFLEMLTILQQNSIAHGDLQHGNILVTKSEIKLVDYDGMYVPGLERKKSNEVGHPAYQHPRRTNNNFDENLDNFSGWLIYLSLLAICVDKDLWQRLQAGDDRLLFSEKDLKDPTSSTVFRELKAINNPEIYACTLQIESFIFGDLSKIPIPTEINLSSPSRTKSTSGQPWIPQPVQPVPPIQIGDWIPHSIEPIKFSSPCIHEQILFLFATGFGIITITVGSYTNLFSIPLALGFISMESVTLILFYKYKYYKMPEIKPFLEFLEKYQKLKIKLTRIETVFKQHSKKLDAINQEEKKKVDQITNQKNSLIARENGEIGAINTQMNRELVLINQERQGLISNKQAEINLELKTLQENYISHRLSQHRLNEWNIPGIGPGLLFRLHKAGINTAADINGQEWYVPGFGPNRVAALRWWKSLIENRIKYEVPASLPPNVINDITRKYDSQINPLNQKEQNIRTLAQNDIENVKSRYMQDHSKMHIQLQMTKNQYQKERESLDRLINTEMAKISGLKAKIQYQNSYQKVYRNISFKNYLKRIVLLKE